MFKSTIVIGSFFAWLIFFIINFVSEFSEFFFNSQIFTPSYYDEQIFCFILASVVPIKVYSNADSMKQDIIKDNSKKVGIYRWINNDNSNSYIGSSINLSNRFRLYYNYDFISDKSKNKSMIHDALVKYGYSKFTLEILEYCDVNLVLEREQYYLDALNPEYNISKVAGSLTGFKHSEESILKRVKAFSENRKIKEDLKAKESNEILLENKPSINFPQKGSARPLEVVEKMRKNHSRSKAVYEYKADKVTLIAKYDSLRQAQEVTGLTREMY